MTTENGAQRALITFDDFSGGLSTRKSPFAIEFNELADAKNVAMSKQGALVKHLGFSAHSDALVKDGSETELFYITGLWAFYPRQGSDHAQLIAFVHGTSHDWIYKISQKGTASVLLSAHGTTSFNSTGVNSSFAMPMFVAYSVEGSSPKDYMIIFSGVSASFATCGAVLYDPSATPPLANIVFKDTGGVTVSYIPQFGCVHKKRLFFSCKDSNNILISEAFPLGTPPNIVLENESCGDFVTGDGDVITGLASLEDYMVVFKNRYIGALVNVSYSGAETYKVDLSSQRGCVAPRSLVSTGSSLIFLAHDGIYALTKQGVSLLSEKLTAKIDQITQHTMAVATFHDNVYRLSYRTGTETRNLNEIWIDMLTGASGYCRFPSVGFGSYASKEPPSSSLALHVSDSWSTVVYKYLDTYLANGVQYESTAELKTVGMPGMIMRSRPRDLFITGESSEDIALTIESGRQTDTSTARFVESGANAGIWDSTAVALAWNSATWSIRLVGQLHKSIGGNITGKWHRLKLYQKGASKFEINHIAILTTMKPMRRIGS